MAASRVRRENLEVPSAQIPLLNSVGGGGGGDIDDRIVPGNRPVRSGFRPSIPCSLVRSGRGFQRADVDRQWTGFPRPSKNRWDAVTQLWLRTTEAPF